MAKKTKLETTNDLPFPRTECSSWERGMNPEQLAAINHDEGPARMLAPAGSGKTRVVTHRIARLVAGRGVDPARILATTFSKKAADEMAERVRALGVEGARVGTLHSLCLQVLRQDKTVWASWELRESTRLELKEVLGYRRMNWIGADPSAVASFIGYCKAQLWSPTSEEASAKAEASFGGREGPLAVQAFALYNALLAEREIITFDDYLVFAAEHLADEGNRARWAARWDYVVQDEAQDENPAQRAVLTALASGHRNYMVVGDVYQCHPPGVMVEVEKGVAVPIEKLRDGDRVRAWNRKAQRMIGGRSVKVASRPYTGAIYRMTAADRSVDMTPNHRVLARWTDRGSRVCVTYLMWRADLGFRVGWCQLFNPSSGALHLGTRAALEKAERTWILGVYESRTDASVQESIVAVRYGIPTITFEPVFGARHLTRESIDRVFAAVRDRQRAGHEALSNFGRHFDFPMLPITRQQEKDAGGRVRGTYFECYAANLIPELMSIPLPDATNAWTPITSVDERDYTGLVYSLDVEEDHSYAVNGLVVLNSIYGWRGSTPDHLARFEEAWPDAVTYWLPRNYRSGRAIVEAANRVVMRAKVPGIEPREMVAERDAGGVAVARVAEDVDGEAENFAAWVTQLLRDGTASRHSDFCALFRVNAQSRAMEESLIAHRIPYVVVGGVSFYERKEVRDLLAYLRLAQGDGELEDVKRCINAPFRFLGAKFIEKVVAAVDRADARGERPRWGDLVLRVADGERIQHRQRESAAEWAGLLEEAEDRIASAAADASPEARDEARPTAILNHIAERTRYLEWLRKEEGEETLESSAAANVRELVRLSEKFATVADLLKYVDDTVRAGRRQRSDRQAGGDRVLLMNCHRSKGLEWPHVWVAGMNEGLMPHFRGDPEEERRLAYVAMTRARDTLVLSYLRTTAPRAGIRDAAPSRFLGESGVRADGPREAPPAAEPDERDDPESTVAALATD